LYCLYFSTNQGCEQCLCPDINFYKDNQDPICKPKPGKRIHQTEKPLEVMRDIVKIVEPGGIILDPFAGAGTMAACDIDMMRLISIIRSFRMLDNSAIYTVRHVCYACDSGKTAPKSAAINTIIALASSMTIPIGLSGDRR